MKIRFPGWNQLTQWASGLFRSSSAHQNIETPPMPPSTPPVNWFESVESPQPISPGKELLLLFRDPSISREALLDILKMDYFDVFTTANLSTETRRLLFDDQ